MDNQKFVRYETLGGLGIFTACDFLRCSRATDRPKWMSRAQWRLASESFEELCRATPVPRAHCYRDARARYPKTWFHAHASAPIALCELLVALLQAHNLVIVPRWTDDPGEIIWQDDVQVIVRYDRVNLPHAERLHEQFAKRLVEMNRRGTSRQPKRDRSTIRRPWTCSAALPNARCLMPDA